MQLHTFRKISSLRGCCTGDAWSSSVRGLNCSLQWGHQRTPRCLLYMAGETAPSRERKVGMTPDQHVPLIPWAAHIIQWSVQKEAIPQGGANPENRPQYGLRSATDLMKLELL